MSIVKDCEEIFVKLQNSIDSLKQYLSVAKYNRNIWENRYRTFEDFCKNEIGINAKVFGAIKAKSVKMPEGIIMSNIWHNKLKLNLYLYTLFILLKAIKENKLWPDPDKISFKEWVKTIKVNETFSKVIGDLLQGGKYAKRNGNNRDANYQEGKSESKDINEGASKRIYRKANRDKTRNGKKFLSSSLRREIRKVGRALASKNKGKWKAI